MKSRWKKYSFLIYITLANLLFLPSLYLVFVRYLRAPADTVYMLLHTDFTPDYYVYLSAITQGKLGEWLFTNPFTVEPQPATIFYLFYILVGKVAALMHMWVPLAYHFAKFFMVELFIVTSYFVSTFALGPTLGIFGAILGITATIGPIELFQEPRAYWDFVPWWNLVESFTRLDGIPHYVAAQSSAMISVLFTWFAFRTKNLRHLIPASLLSLAAAIMLPTSVFPLLLGYPLSCGIVIIRSLARNTYKKDVNWQFIAGLAGMCILIALVFLYQWSQTSGDITWILYKQWEVDFWNNAPNFTRDLVFSFGIILPLALLGFFSCVYKGTWPDILVAVWAILPFLLLPFINLLGMGKIRVIYQAPFIPLGILAARWIFSRSGLWIKAWCLIFCIFTIPTTVHLFALHLQTAKTTPIWYNEYLMNPVFEAIDYTNANLPKNSNFISNRFLGAIISSQTTMRSYVAHLGQTISFGEKNEIAERFFRGEISQGDAQNLFRMYRISYVYVGWQDNLEYIGAYPFVTRVFQNPVMTIYKVQ